MGQRSDGRSSSVVGILKRYRGVAFSLLFVGMMLTWAVTGTTALQGGAASIADAGRWTSGTQADATEVDSCTVIDEPGQYELVGDIEGTATDACIQIKSDDVVLDGNGHTVRGEDVESGVGILVFNGSREGYPREGSALNDVTVRNVEVSNWKRGVQIGETLDSGPTVTLRNVTVTNNGGGMSLFGADESRLENVDVSDNERAGIVVWETRNLTAEGITANRNGGSGISFSDVVLDSSFSDVTVTGNDGHGIHFSTVAVNNSVTGAYVANNDGAGVSFVDSSDNVVRDSTVVDNTGPGVLADPANGDRIENVSVGGNEIAYRNGVSGARYGVIADGLRLDSGVVASFDQNVSSFDGEESVPEPPRDARTAGPAANLTMSDEAAAEAQVTITFPYADEAVGNESTLSVFRYSDGTWRPVAATSVDAENQTVTATVRESGVFVPVYADQSGPVSGNQSTFVVNVTGKDGDTDEVAYGFIVEGEVHAASSTVLPTEDGEEHVEERSDGTTVVLGSTGTDGGDTFVVSGEIVKFATQPRKASVQLALDGEDVTDRLVDGNDEA